jgi:SAM-dependent methyltransferase
MNTMKDYCNDLWPLVYDQFNHGRHEQELAFYTRELTNCTGPVLEVACGTGMILLPLLERGLDIYGFDLSEQMLEKLVAKAERDGHTGIKRRVTVQNMVDFQYGMQFQAIFIPARSFLHLTTQDEQIACLQNIHRHLCDDGCLMLNFFTPSLQALLDNTRSNPAFREFATYRHPETNKEIKLSVCQVNDLTEQIQHITWRFDVAGETQDSPMLVRWVYRWEFELLARLSGFRVAALYSGFDREPYKGDGEMVWVLKKITQP